MDEQAEKELRQKAMDAGNEWWFRAPLGEPRLVSALNAALDIVFQARRDELKFTATPSYYVLNGIKHEAPLYEDSADVLGRVITEGRAMGWNMTAEEEFLREYLESAKEGNEQ